LQPESVMDIANRIKMMILHFLDFLIYCLLSRRSVLPGVFPNKGQSDDQLEKDKYACYEWAKKQSGFDPADVVIKSRSRAHAHPGSMTIYVHLIGDRKTGRLLGAQMVGKEGAAHRINAAAVALHNKMTVAHFSQTDLAYAPPFGPVWDPLLTAANQLMKKISP